MRTALGNRDDVVGYVCFGVGAACSWNVVRDRVVQRLTAYVACPTPTPYVLAHLVLHGTVALDHTITPLSVVPVTCTHDVPCKAFGCLV